MKRATTRRTASESGSAKAPKDSTPHSVLGKRGSSAAVRARSLHTLRALSPGLEWERAPEQLSDQRPDPLRTDQYIDGYRRYADQEGQ